MIRNYSLSNPIPFIGRTNELEEISARLQNPECRLLTLTGLGGSGKTRLAIEAAHTLAPRFSHATVFVSLQPLTRSDLLVPTIAQALGLKFYGKGELESQLLDYLCEKTLLLILDNFEHVLDGAALVTKILAYAPGVKVLVTSREALNLREEWLYPLKGMPTPPSVYVYSTSLEKYESVQLFLYHAHRIQPSFDPVIEHKSIINICQMTAGLPLAIELAASWLKGSSATQIAREMQCNLDFLSTTTRNVEERHRSMRAVFDQSWRLMSENERLIFARLSVFNGGFDGESAEAVAEASFTSLAALVEKSLIQMESTNRFGVHEMLRQYAVEKLGEYGETEATYARHSSYFAQLILRYESALQQPEQLEIMQAIERDFENIRLAWEWSFKNERVTNLHAMLNGLYLFGFLGSRYCEIITLFQNTLEQSVTDASLRGRLLARRWGYFQWWYQDDYEEALTSIEQALIIALAGNNQFEVAFCHLMIAYVLINSERYAEALPHAESSKALFEAINEPYYVCWALHRMGYIYGSLNNIEKVNEYTEQSLSLARITHNRVALFICLYNLGSDYTLDGDHIKGKHYGAEALQVATESGHHEQIAHALSLLALCAFYQGDYATCQDYAERSRTIIDNINSLVFEPYSQSLLIVLACLREDYAEGVRLNELGKRHGTSNTDFQLHFWALAALSCGLGNPVEARIYIQKMLQLATSDGPSVTTTWLVPSAAYTLVQTDPEKAIELLAWVFSYPDTALNWVRQWPLFNQILAPLQARMDNDAYQKHWAKGESLTFESVKTYLHNEFSTLSDAETESDHQHLLTARENEILHLMAVGMTNPQIAAQLVIGTGTVKTHSLNIYRKLDVLNRTQAIVRAQELGLLHA